MPKSRKRKPGRRPRRPRGTPSSDWSGVLAHFASLDDALAVEELLSGLLGVAYAEQVVHRQQEVDVLAQSLLSSAMTSSRPGSLELVAVLAAAGPVAVVPAAQDELARRLATLAADDRPVPPIVAALGAEVRCTGAWSVTDMFGDATQYLARFDRVGVPGAHAMGWLVEQNQGPYAKKVILAPDGDDFLEESRVLASADPDLTWSELDPAVLHARVRLAMDLETSMLGGPADEEDDYPMLRGLGYARLTALPLPAALPPVAEVSAEEREALLDRFMASEGVREVVEGDAFPDDAEGPSADVMRSLGSLAVDYGADVLGDPTRVSPQNVEIFLLGWVPRSTVLDPEQTLWLPAILTVWVDWAGEQRGLSERHREELQDAATDVQVDFYAQLVGAP